MNKQDSYGLFPVPKAARGMNTFSRWPALFAIMALTLVLFAGFAGAVELRTYSVSLRPGEYSSYSIEGPYIGMHRGDGSVIGWWDNPAVFGSSEHSQADFLWFTRGWLSWNYPVVVPLNAEIQSISYKAEISSEFPGSYWNWPSVVNLSFNGTTVGAWTIPGDPDAAYGYALMPNKLSGNCSQYGWLTTWTVDKTGTYLEYKFRLGDKARAKISDVTLNQIPMTAGNDLAVKLSIPGQTGLNIYGAVWGDYPVDPTVTITYEPVIQVAIDIKPGSYPNSINLGSNGDVPVAILSTTSFDAGKVDPATVTLAGASVALHGKGTPAVSMEDVNGDGLLDIVLHVSTSALELTSDDTLALLSGKTVDGIKITGYDTVRIVPN